MKQNAFTLLELIVVITIISVLTALALPRLFTAIERSRSAEAITALNTWRQAIERCALWNDSVYDANCISEDFSVLDINNPFDSPGSHFEVEKATVCDGSGREGYFLVAQRKVEPGLTDSGGPIPTCTAGCQSLFTVRSSVSLCVDITGGVIEVGGSGFYKGI